MIPFCSVIYQLLYLMAGDDLALVRDISGINAMAYNKPCMSLKSWLSWVCLGSFSDNFFHRVKYHSGPKVEIC